MRRIAALLAGIGLAVGSILLAQSPTQATLRLPQGDRQVTTVTQPPLTFVAADEFVASLGGSLVRDTRGFRLIIGNVEAAFASDSRFAVIGENLLEMPAAPLIVDTRPFVPWEFFRDVLNTAGRDLKWDPLTTVFEVRTLERQAVNVEVSVVDLEEITKIVFQFSNRADATTRRDPEAFMLQFRQTLRPPFPERIYDSPYVQKIVFQGNEIRVQLASDQVAGDMYRLENPFRIVLDLRKGEGVATPDRRQLRRPVKPVDLPGIRTIVLDPGHGGKEVGAIGAKGLQEKETTLAISRKLANLLAARLGTRVVLTRYDDSVVPLDQRTAIANQYKADLFLSIHLNASAVRGAHGSETYFLSVEASDEFARHAAERENAPSDATTEAVPSSDVRLILWDLAQQQYLKESSRFAELVQEEMNVITGVRSRGVKQAPFKVLVGASMPAALVEVGFISNPDEEAKLSDDAFQSTIANALLKAVERYKAEIDAKNGVAISAPQRPPQSDPPAPVPAVAKRGT